MRTLHNYSISISVKQYIIEYVKKFLDNLECVFYSKKLLFFNKYKNN